YPDKLEQDPEIVVADEDSNSLIFRGPASAAADFVDVLATLEQSEAAETGALAGRRRDASSPSSPRPGAASGSPSENQNPGDERPMKVFRLEHANARSFSSALFVLYPEMNDTVNIVTDPRTNSLIVRGPQSALDAIQAIVRLLDSAGPGAPRPRSRLGEAV